MEHAKYDHHTGRHESAGTRREQAFCMSALETGDYDAMSDKEWVSLCEEVAGDCADASPAGGPPRRQSSLHHA